MKNKKVLTVIILCLAVLLISAGATFAFIVASSRTVENTMTVGNVYITLTETEGNNFKILPGVSHVKDPTVTVQKDSLDSWIFIRQEASSDLHLYAEYAIDDGWIPLQGEAGVYYRRYYTSANDTIYPIIKDNKVTIYEDVTEEDLALIHINPTLKFTAYAVQMDMMDNPDVAWDTVIAEKGE